MADEDKGEKMPERRQFLLNMARGIGGAAVGGLAWAGFLDGKKAHATVLRPPGAVAEKEFLARCTKCGLCVEACPFKALILAAPGDERPIGTPYFRMRENPCRMCRDIPCAVSCPTGALDSSLVSADDAGGRTVLDINAAKIGLAVIDRETCIAYWGIQCDACYRACPVIDKAICADIMHLPFKSNSIDGLWNLGVMEHFTKQEIIKALAEFARVLKPGSYAVLFWPPKIGHYHLMTNSIEFFSNRVLGKKIDLFPDEISLYSPSLGIAHMARSCGFSECIVEFTIRDLLTYAVVICRKG